MSEYSFVFPLDFYDFLQANPSILQGNNLARVFSDMCAAYRSSCKCNRKVLVPAVVSSYRSLIANIPENDQIQIKTVLNVEKIIFMLKDEVAGTI
jgi:hypothetical protein